MTVHRFQVLLETSKYSAAILTKMYEQVVITKAT